jgi:pyruvate formate lyase activating enzyme
LQYIVEHNLQDRCLIRIPLIPDYTSQADQQRDKEILEEMGFTRFDLFNYKIPKRHE